MRLYLTKNGDMVDGIAYKFYGKTSGIVEQIYAQNRHLADQGDILVEGISIFLPVIETTEIRKEHSLWD